MRIYLLCSLAAALTMLAGPKKLPCVTVNDASTLRRYMNECVVLHGKVSDIPWQHMVGTFKGYPRTAYFDVGSFQIVVYSRTPISCTGEVEVTGKVREVKGLSKGPEPRETFTEYHVTADSWKCTGN